MDFEVIYGSDFSVQGYRDTEFQADFAWDTDLLSGYNSRFLKPISDGGFRNYEENNGDGVLEALSTLKPDTVLVLGYNARFDKAVISAAKRLNIPTMIRSEASDVALDRSRLKSLVRDWVLASLYKRFRKLLYVGRNSFQHYQRLGVDAKKLVFSPYCVSTVALRCSEEDRAELREAMRTQLDLQPDTIAILFCGKLSQRKGVDVLLQAVKRLPTEIRERTMLLYVGEGALRAELESHANQSPPVNLHITGFKNQCELSPYYHAADVAVLPSVNSETWGLVVNEALHHGVPCLVSDRVGCGPDLIQSAETGEVFPACNSESLALAIQRFLPKLGTSELRARCRGQVENYSVAKAAEGIRDGYVAAASDQANANRKTIGASV